LTLIQQKRATTGKLDAPRIAAILARQVFQRELVCPNCMWTGHEADLLVVHASLRLIDIEIKTSRTDLRADIEKDKWWHYPFGGHWRHEEAKRVRLDWPPKVWKHYYAVPAEIWHEGLLAEIPAFSGVLTLRSVEPYQWRNQVGPLYAVKTVRRAKPNSQADKISAADAVNIARLASIRYWAVLAGNKTRWAEAS
jgi:hypothetical protein